MKGGLERLLSGPTPRHPQNYKERQWDNREFTIE
jgi:hypothetical protein